MEEGAEGGEVVKWMDGWIRFGGSLGGGEVGFDWRGWVGMSFFVFFFFSFCWFEMDFVGGE